MDRSRIAIIIPAFNEEATIARVVEDIQAYGVPIVVDDASTDNTRECAKMAGAVVVWHDANQGYDGALNTGFAEARARECAYAVTLDADGQHDASAVPEYLDRLDEGADVVLGVRSSMPRWSERLFGLVFGALYGVHDPMCGMKGFRMKVYEDIGHFDCYGSIGTELILHAARCKYTIAEVEARTAERRAGQSRFGQSLGAHWRLLRALVLGLIRTPCSRAEGS